MGTSYLKHRVRTKQKQIRRLGLLAIIILIPACTWLIHKSVGRPNVPSATASRRGTNDGVNLSTRRADDQYLPRRPALLDMSSLWAVGRDARSAFSVHKDVPLLTWTDAAVKRVGDAWRAVQFRETCDRVIYMTRAYDWGITSQMRDYSDLLIVSALAFNRTLILASDAERPKWCKENAWLGCFFEPLSANTCSKALAQLRGLSVVKAWPGVVNGTDDIPSSLGGRRRALKLVSSARFVNLLEDPSYFPVRLWQDMVASGEVHMHAIHGARIRIDITSYCHQHHGPDRAHLCHTLALSALRSMLAGIVFRPRVHILQASHDIMARLARMQTQVHTESTHPARCLAVHLRWTDKATDGGQAASLTKDAMLAGVERALKRIARMTGRAYQCLLVLSDDDEVAVGALKQVMGSAITVVSISDIRSMFGSPREYDAYRSRGHEYVLAALSTATPRSLMRSRKPDHYRYFSSVIVDAWIASLAADYLIGVGTSGVSQLVAQWLGARMHADGNGFAVWQEDLN